MSKISPIDERLAFSQRLKQALSSQGIVTHSPTKLAKAFNIRFSGAPISVQTASNWLSGVTFPSQEKLQVLAHWLKVSPQWLRFGEDEPNLSILESSHEPEQFLDLADKIAQLNAKQKQAIYAVVEAMLNA